MLATRANPDKRFFATPGPREGVFAREKKVGNCVDMLPAKPVINAP